VEGLEDGGTISLDGHRLSAVLPIPEDSPAEAMAQETDRQDRQLRRLWAIGLLPEKSRKLLYFLALRKRPQKPNMMQGP
jgi:hypothetical protein